jgi:hypothetical protein
MFDAYVIKGGGLLVARPKGILDVTTTGKIIDLIEIKEVLAETGFNRFCDLTCLEGIQLLSADILKFANRRRAYNPNDIRVKSAFLATDPLAFGMARMYEQLLNSPRIEVRVWDNLQAAADWLGVKADQLTL